jgi:hypothetical protein
MLGKEYYSRRDLCEMIPLGIALPEVPRTHPLNYVLVWKRACSPAPSTSSQPQLGRRAQPRHSPRSRSR